MGREHIPRMVSFAGKTMSIQAAGAVWKEGEGCMDKKEAIQICRNKGLPITAHISNLASKNIRKTYTGQLRLSIVYLMTGGLF